MGLSVEIYLKKLMCSGPEMNKSHPICNLQVTVYIYLYIQINVMFEFYVWTNCKIVRIKC